MKNLIKNLLLLSLISLILSSPAWAVNDPLDLATLKKSGLSQNSISRFIAQNLEKGRLTPPLEAKFMTSLAKYGGDDLVASYLAFDEKNALIDKSAINPAMIEEMVKNDLGLDNIKTILDGEVHKIDMGQIDNTIDSKEQTATAASSVDDNQKQAQEAAAATLPAASPQAAPDNNSAQNSNTAAVPAGPKTPGYHHDMYYSLKPGQAADPAQLLPPEVQVAPIRSQSEPGPWMGVKERQLPDNHRYEVNTSGDTSLLGQEVLLRPSGDKVYRYHIGKPDSPQSGADPRQEAINQEQLNTIFSGKNQK